LSFPPARFGRCESANFWTEEIEKKFEGQEKVPVPEFWGGLRIKPVMVEFWQGRESRLHDRFQYVKAEEGDGHEGGKEVVKWKIERLSP
jgi:pyridoxamine 5'-phosphate oxidase